MPIFLSGPAFLLKFHIRSKILFVTSSSGSRLISSFHWIMPYLSLRPLVPCICFLYIPQALFSYLFITILVLTCHREMVKLHIQSFNFPFCYPIDQNNKNNSFEETLIQLLHLSYGECNMQKKILDFPLKISFYWTNAIRGVFEQNATI